MAAITLLSVPSPFWSSARKVNDICVPRDSLKGMRKVLARRKPARTGDDTGLVRAMAEVAGASVVPGTSGLTVLAAAIALGDFLATLLKTGRIGEILRESLTIGGWVSMWRPLEIFLYDWWPIGNEARLSDRLVAMPVRIRYMNATSPDAWKADWPVATASAERAKTKRPPDALNSAT
jgi:hypothetical protein